MSAEQNALVFDEAEPFSESEEDLGDFGAFDAVVVSTDWTTETILSQITRENIELTPEFQRRDAWDRRRKSRFIESLIVGLPIPQIVLAERRQRRGEFVVLDGKQRLLSLQQFLSPAGFRLSNLDLRPDLNGLTYDNLPSGDRSALDTQTIRTIVVRNWQREEFLFLIFLRLNTESVSLSPQELRQALHPGPFVKFVNDFTADNSEFYSLFRRKTPDFRMRDVELLVRFFAFNRFLPSYIGNLKPLLDYTCEELNRLWVVEEETIRSEAAGCKDAISATVEIFGEHSFRRWNGSSFERPFNRAVFDVMTFYFADSGLRDRVLQRAEDVRAGFMRLCANDYFTEAVTTTTKSREAIFTRLEMWGHVLEEMLETSLPVPVTGPGGRIAYATA